MYHITKKKNQLHHELKKIDMTNNLQKILITF
jgi:hypothetical protein